MSRAILDVAEERAILLDGGLGTELMKSGFPRGACPEAWNVEKPEIIRDIHQSYFEAGSDAVLTNSFGGNPITLAEHGEDNRCFELNKAAALLARDVKPEGRFVGGSMGPTGKLLKPQGPYTEEEFEMAFAEQARGLTEGGVDFLIIETQYDLREALSALRGARKVSHLPLFVTMTFKSVPRGFFTIMGDSVAKSMETLGGEGILAVGANCTVGSAEMVELVKEMRERTDLPIIAQANAGQPSVTSEGNLVYSEGIEDYAGHVSLMVENGAGILGGCCGTGPDYIRKMAEVLGLD